jgi:uncharacterized protein YdhG (YjbR/CyaY superfamily)
MDEAVQSYIDAIAREHRPLFDRLHRLTLEIHPEATLALSYKMPTYTVGRNHLYVGAWKHGVSLYGWEQDAVADFSSRHPRSKTSRGTIRLRPEDSDATSDEELRGLIRAALDR